MIRLILVCLALILTNVVSAQAAFTELHDNQVEKATWMVTHSGAGELDGLQVIATLEMAEQEIVIPEMLSGDFQSLVPLAPVKKKTYRLALVAAENSRLRAQYSLERKVASVDGFVRQVFLSTPDSSIRFVITALSDSRLRVQFSKKTSAATFETGEFTLDPAVRPLVK